jgi:adenylosuccinate synthase
VPGTCVIGLQWGDEAKGKLVDLLTPQFGIVVRYQGGANAGHTVVFDGKTFKLHHVPSGILAGNSQNVIGPGVVINPATLLEEIDGLVSRGIDVAGRLMISQRAHVVCPWHIEEDRVLNALSVDGENIGTTLRGIGPCYRDKVGRMYAVRMIDMLHDDFPDRVQHIVAAKNAWLKSTAASKQLDADEIVSQYTGFADRLKPYVQDTTHFLLEALERGEQVLFEGAQGALLDVDHGTYPFVTSSNSSGVGVCAGAGVPPKWIDKVVGVIKTYATRVGGGPFPTELDNPIGEHIRDRGNEFGTTTGRPRRCGWFDAVAVRYTAKLSGVTSIAAMMLDVLSELDELRICVAYEIDGERTERFPSHVDDLRRATPVFENLAGWQEDVTGVRSWDDLPENARAYLGRIAELIGCPVAIVSVGPDRAQTIRRERNFDVQVAGISTPVS